MEGFKEFQGKDLDSAIEEACGYFSTAREKLEIEIVQDSKSGIFGIVGARKAKVRARRVQLRETVENILGRKGGQTAPPAAPAEAASEPVACAEGKAKAARQRDDASSSAPRQEKRHDRARGRKGAQDDTEAGVEGPADAAAAQSDSPRDAERSGGSTCQKPEKKSDKSAGRSEKNTPRNGDKSARKDGTTRNGDENGACQSEKSAEKATCAGKNGEKSDRASGRGQNGHAENGRRGEGRGRKSESREGREPRESREGRDSREGRESREPRNASRENGRDVSRLARPGTSDMLDDDFEEVAEGMPVTPLEQLDQERLMALVHQTVRSLVRPIVGEAVQLEVAVIGGRVQVGIESEEDSGLLIGREGQTLAALQYMISRIVSRGMNAAVRVQLDAGEYRRRQDERLREMALALADKVRQNSRSYSTRPLSSYHRRIVHVCLQDATDVQTRSTGDGPLKRVVILRRKTEKS